MYKAALISVVSLTVGYIVGYVMGRLRTHPWWEGREDS